MPIHSWDDPSKCCILLKSKEEYTHPDETKQEIPNIMSSMTVILRGTEHQNCSICEHTEYKETGQCIKRCDYNKYKRDELEKIYKG